MDKSHTKKAQPARVIAGARTSKNGRVKKTEKVQTKISDFVKKGDGDTKIIHKKID